MKKIIQDYKINEKDVVWREIQGEVVLLNLETGDHFNLNKTGSLIWLLLARGKETEEIINRLAKKYRLSKKRATADITEMFRGLKSEGLVVLQK